MANHKSSATTQAAYLKPVSKSELRDKLKLLKFKQQEIEKEVKMQENN